MTSNSRIRAALCLFALVSAVASAQSNKGAGQISGRVLNANDSPAAGIDVVIVPISDTRINPDNSFPVARTAIVARTDGEGKYQAANVAAGSYHVAAGTIVKCPPRGACPIPQWIARPTYFPGVVNLGAAKPVVVASGTVTVDFRIPLL
jgi:hypothetical protein